VGRIRPSAGGPAPDLTATSVRGSSWLLLSTGVTSALQLVSAAVLGRLLSPVDFGVVAAAMLVIRIVYYFSQFGLGSAIVQKHDLSDDDIRAGAWLAVVIGAIATCIGVAVAPPLAALLDQSGAVRVARVLSVTFLITGLATTPLALLRRSLRFRAVAALEVSSYAVGYLVVGLGAALIGAGLWSLVLAALTQGIVQAGCAVLLVRHPVALLPPRGCVAPLARFGGKVSVIGLLEFWSLQVDTIGVARGRDAADLGQYTRGNVLAYPVVQVSLVLTRVLLSAFARMSDIARLRNAYSDALVLLASGSLIAAAVLAGGHDALVTGLLGSQWAPAAGLLPWLAAASALQGLSQLPAALCEARGVLRPKLWITVAVVAVLALAVGSAIRLRSPLWVYAACWLLSESVRQILYLVVVARRFGLGLASLLSDLRAAAIPALVTLAGVAAVESALRSAGEPLPIRLAAVLITGISIPLSVSAVLPRSRLRRIVRDRRLLDAFPVGRRGRRFLGRLLA
jgi:lipopolysaccharide exporter